jgi:hypothetical protein
MPAAEAAQDAGGALQEAFSRYFRYRAETTRASLGELFRIGRYSLAVGVLVLALCIGGGQLIVCLPGSQHFGPLAREGLVILGWVANWRPIEIFLYDWWPIARRRSLFERLARADVQVNLR